MIEADPTARISPLADLEPSQRGSRYIIGPRTVIDAFVKFKPAGGLGNIKVGADSYINSGCVLYSGHGITIGANVLIAANCTLAAVNHAFADPFLPIKKQGFQPPRGGIVIGDDVWIGANCVLLDGAQIGAGAVIAAGSVVRGVVEPFAVMAGNPLLRIGTRGIV